MGVRGAPRRFWHGRDVALVYAAIIVVTTVALVLLPDHVADSLVLRSSTNLANLRRYPLLVLVASAFVVPTLAGLLILPPLVIAYGAVQRWLGRGATVVTAVLGHVGATLFVATILAAGIARGRIGLSVAQATDVGASYGLMAAAGLLAARVPRRWMAAYVGVISGLLLAVLLLVRGFTDLGHAAAWVIGLGLALLVTRARAAATARLDPAGAGAV